jgi:hypothetical protein
MFHSFRDTSLQGGYKGVGAVGYTAPVSINVGTTAGDDNYHTPQEPSYFPLGKCLEQSHKL